MFNNINLKEAHFNKSSINFLDLGLGQLPILRIGDVTVCQTRAITAYIYSQTSLPKLEPMEAIRSDQVLETIHEMFVGIVKPSFGSILQYDGKDTITYNCELQFVIQLIVTRLAT